MSLGKGDSARSLNKGRSVIPPAAEEESGGKEKRGLGALRGEPKRSVDGDMGWGEIFL
jgi:hypothetical protein